MSLKSLFRRQALTAAARLGDPETVPSHSDFIRGSLLHTQPSSPSPLTCGPRPSTQRSSCPGPTRGAALRPAARPSPDSGGSPGGAGGEPRGGVRQVRFSPRHRLPRETSGPRDRAQVSANNAKQSPQYRPVHAGLHGLRARDREGWGPGRLRSWQSEEATRASSEAASGAPGSRAPAGLRRLGTRTPRDPRGAART